MREDECKDCGAGLVFVGSLMSGKMVCRHCEQVEQAPENLHTPSKSHLYDVGDKKVPTGTPGDQAYGLNCHHAPDICCPQCVEVVGWDQAFVADLAYMGFSPPLPRRK